MLLNPGVTYAVYTEFESDEHGEYVYFIGEEVESLDDQRASDPTKAVVDIYIAVENK